jgi:hypothetical protein
MARANKALLDLGLASMNLQQERTMDALTKGFRNEVKSLSKATPSLSGMEKDHE